VNRSSATPAGALLLTGTVGSGKTSVADAIGDLLSHAGIANAAIDVDWLRHSWPCPPEDPFNGKLALRHLSAVARNYLQAGVARLVLAGVIESRAARVEDVVVDATTTSIRSTAEAVMAAVGW
jgi:adenylylsulfate kinase